MKKTRYRFFQRDAWVDRDLRRNIFDFYVTELSKYFTTTRFNSPVFYNMFGECTYIEAKLFDCFYYMSAITTQSKTRVKDPKNTLCLAHKRRI